MDSASLPLVWVIVKDGRVIATHDEPCSMNDIAGVRYIPEPDAGLSWDGYRIMGNRASIEAVQKTLHAAHTVELMRERIKELEKKLYG